MRAGPGSGRPRIRRRPVRDDPSPSCRDGTGRAPAGCPAGPPRRGRLVRCCAGCFRHRKAVTEARRRAGRGQAGPPGPAGAALRARRPVVRAAGSPSGAVSSSGSEASVRAAVPARTGHGRRDSTSCAGLLASRPPRSVGTGPRPSTSSPRPVLGACAVPVLLRDGTSPAGRAGRRGLPGLPGLAGAAPARSGNRKSCGQRGGKWLSPLPVVPKDFLSGWGRCVGELLWAWRGRVTGLRGVRRPPVPRAGRWVRAGAGSRRRRVRAQP